MEYRVHGGNGRGVAARLAQGDIPSKTLLKIMADNLQKVCYQENRHVRNIREVISVPEVGETQS